MNPTKSRILTQNGSGKSFCDVCSRKTGYCQDASAKASVVWNTRNNSSNVSSLLAPDVYEKSTSPTSNGTVISKSIPRRCIKSAVLIGKAEELSTLTHCEECYCRESPNLPLLDLKPSCRGEIGSKRTGVRLSMGEFRRQRSSHGVKRIPKDLSVNTKMIWGDSRSSEELSKSNLTYTDTRSDYESRSNEFRKPTQQDDRIKSAGYNGNDDRNRDDRNVEINDKRMTYRDFKELSNFRKEQYFECHSCDNIATSEAIPPHKCVHKFVINNRLLPEPVNCDSYGVSRCEICNKPMETFKNERPRSETVKKSANKMKEMYEYNLKPPRLNIGRGKEIVQIKVPERVKNECLWQSPSFKITRKVPGNSYALRFQKGCF